MKKKRKQVSSKSSKIIVSIINLYEYQNKEKNPILSESGDFEKQNDFEAFLDEIWNLRKESSFCSANEEENYYDRDLNSEQKFISFLKNRREIKSRKYVGVIKYEDTLINLYPKIFYKKNSSKIDQTIINKSIFWWLSYNRKFRFPKYVLSQKRFPTRNFLEIFIYLYSVYTKKTLSNIVYQSYQDVSREIKYMKGRLDIKSYVNEGMVTGNWQKMFCTYDSFEIDNQFNRIIKYVSKMLLNISRYDENKQLLKDIIFILDEVEDVNIDVNDCNKVQLNPLFSDLELVLDYCKLFLSHCSAYSFKNEFKLYAFLIPMETIFEEFLYGFIKEHKEDIFENCTSVKIEYQKGDKYLATVNDENVFKLIHDMLITFDKEGKRHSVIIDSKYKLTYTEDKTTSRAEKLKNGVSQSDMYQMASYAIRRKCNELFLMYPKTIDDKDNICRFKIKDAFTEDMEESTIININIKKIPIIVWNEVVDAKQKLIENLKRIENC